MSDKTSEPDSSTDLSAELRTAVGRVHRRFRSERLDGELGDAALSVLLQLRRFGPRGLTELSEHARVTPGSMSQTVNRLTEGGLAVRTPDPDDGRRVLFTPTPEGARLAAETNAPSVAWLDSQLDRLTAHERSVLLEASAIMQRIADSDLPSSGGAQQRGRGLTNP